jgi:hypothetical protein
MKLHMYFTSNNLWGINSNKWQCIEDAKRVYYVYIVCMYKCRTGFSQAAEGSPQIKDQYHVCIYYM